MKYPDYVDFVIKRLEAGGESAYVVGGGLRDIIIGTEPHDYDVASSALPEKTAELFSDMRVIKTGLKHGTVTVISGGFPVEITTFRIDGEYTDSRHPDYVCFTDDIVLDLSRRDFTVNAMAYSETRGLIDPFGGRADIERKIIRAVGNAEKRFGEDALRIMRAFRFSAQLGFSIDGETLGGARTMAAGLANIARERIAAELLKTVTADKPYDALMLMKETDIFRYVSGEYVPSDELLRLISEMPRTDTARLGLLLYEADEVTAREILNSLRLSNKQITGALAVRRGAYFKIENALDARRLIAATGVYASEAAKLSELAGVSPVGACGLVSEQIGAPCSIRDLKINGKDVAELGGTGRQIGDTLSRLLELVMEKPELNGRGTLTELAKQIIKEKEGKNDGA